jgi:hypothetical protein
MNLAARILVLRARREVRAAARQRRKRLESELAQYATQAQRDDLLATLDRYPDGQTSELRQILTAQTFARSRRHLCG